MNKISWVLLVLCIAITFSSLIYISNQSTHTAYVDLEIVFSEFKGKKEMEVGFMNSNNLQKAILDSMAIEINEINNQMSKENEAQAVFANLKKKQKNYIQKVNEFSEIANFQEAQITEKIWSQINQYIYEYGEENGFDFIYGLHQAGNLMYAKQNKNITKEVVEHINKRYEGY